jgi:hypothetical protein
MKREVMSTIGFRNVEPIWLFKRAFVKEDIGSGGVAAGGLEGPSYVAVLVQQRPMID